MSTKVRFQSSFLTTDGSHHTISHLRIPATFSVHLLLWRLSFHLFDLFIALFTHKTLVLQLLSSQNDNKRSLKQLEKHSGNLLSVSVFVMIIFLVLFLRKFSAYQIFLGSSSGVWEDYITLTTVQNSESHFLVLVLNQWMPTTRSCQCINHHPGHIGTWYVEFRVTSCHGLPLQLIYSISGPIFDLVHNYQSFHHSSTCEDGLRYSNGKTLLCSTSCGSCIRLNLACIS